MLRRNLPSLLSAISCLEFIKHGKIKKVIATRTMNKYAYDKQGHELLII
jgi:hypothetical protein